jgi:NADPH:quinone reductase
MKAWLLPQLGGVDLLELRDVPDPVPGPGEVLLAVEYAALNPADYYLAEGQYPARPPLPHVLGRDGLGTVLAVGAGAGDFRVGEAATIVRSEVGVTRFGTLAEKVAVPAESLVRPPAGWTGEQAAAATLVYLTAHQALTQWGDLPPGVVLVTGASGGVGVATVQLAKAMGHTVVALSRGQAKKPILLRLGADVVLDPTDSQWRRRLKEALPGRPVDLAIDNVGGEGFNDLLSVLGQNGRVSVVGRLAGPVPSFNTASLFFRRLRIGGVAVGAQSADESHAAWDQVVRRLARRGDKPVIDRVFGFEAVPAAFARLREGPMGKVVVRVMG